MAFVFRIFAKETFFVLGSLVFALFGICTAVGFIVYGGLLIVKIVRTGKDSGVEMTRVTGATILRM